MSKIPDKRDHRTLRKSQETHMPLSTREKLTTMKKIIVSKLIHKNTVSPTKFQSNLGGVQYKVEMENKYRIIIAMD